MWPWHKVARQNLGSQHNNLQHSQRRHKNSLIGNVYKPRLPRLIIYNGPSIFQFFSWSFFPVFYLFARIIWHILAAQFILGSGPEPRFTVETFVSCGEFYNFKSTSSGLTYFSFIGHGGETVIKMCQALLQRKGNCYNNYVRITQHWQWL